MEDASPSDVNVDENVKHPPPQDLIRPSSPASATQQYHVNSNCNGWRHNKRSSQNELLDEIIDEEHGFEQFDTNSSTLLQGGNNRGEVDAATANTQHNANGNTMEKQNRTSCLPSSSLLSATAAVDHGGADHHHHDDNTTMPSLLSSSSSSNHSSMSDQRSRTLYLKTAFWITAWYSTSLATLFLNKIILSRPNSSVHVLGMCQMTTAAVLGGWSTFGGLDYLTRLGRGFFYCFMDEYYRCRRLCRGGGATSIIKSHRVEDSIEGSALLASYSWKSDAGTVRSTKSKSTNAVVATGGGSGGGVGGISVHFARDMSIVGILRGVTVVLGLVALEHVPVSFVETIKATAPAFTVLFARLILQERTAPQVMLTLVPVVGGLILCSASELRFDTIGFVAAVMNNCADCVQNVMTKRMLAHMKPTQLQFYTSVAALALQTPLILRDVSGLVVRNWTQHSAYEDIDTVDEGEDELLERHLDTTEDDGQWLSSSNYNNHSEWSLTKLLIVDAIFYHFQSVSAYCTMGCMNPVSQSVANTLKRALLVWASLLYFGNPVTSSGIVGILMVVVGVFLYNHVRRMHQS